MRPNFSGPVGLARQGRASDLPNEKLHPQSVPERLQTMLLVKHDVFASYAMQLKARERKL